MINNRKLIYGLLISVLVSISIGTSTKSFGESEKPALKKEDSRPNFVVILTDDQRSDTLWAMENLQKELVTRGTKFTEGFVSTALSCPSRACILTGLYSHHSGILKNLPPYGSARVFRDSQKEKQTMAVWLQNNGYKTALIGKYLNGYHYLSPEVPPGWDKWIVITHRDLPKDDITRGFTKYSASIDGNKMIKNPTKYSTDFLFEEGLKFINNSKNRPFFLYLTIYAPHKHAFPAEQDKNKFNGFIHRPPSYNEKDISDKKNPKVQGRKPFWGKRQKELDEFARNQLRSLPAVDRGIKNIIDELENKGLLKNTVIIFASDHGIFWGEHRLQKKTSPYEEAIRVPFIIYVPGVPGGRIDSENMVLTIDIAPTVLELAGVEKPKDVELDGKSIVPILKDPDARLRDGFRVEFVAPKFRGAKRTFYGFRTSKFKLIEYLTGEREFYDLQEDPYELENQYENPDYKDVIADLGTKVDVLKEEVKQFFIEEESKQGDNAEMEEETSGEYEYDE